MTEMAVLTAPQLVDELTTVLERLAEGPEANPDQPGQPPGRGAGQRQR